MRKIRLTATMVCLFIFTAIAMAQEVGNATYYANKFHGRRTSDGSVYHKDSMTCANKHYPFGTILKVRNQKTGKEVFVKVTDRGPFRRDRIIDLSYEAAKQLGIIGAGIAKVEITQAEQLRVPFLDTREISLPNLQLEDPKTGEYYTLPEWKTKMQQTKAGRAMARSFPKKISKPVFKNVKGNSKDTLPRWRVVEGKLSAKAMQDDLEGLVR
ncbi:MAG: septal ring lytic transglycosylase RlpA family protein [Bacteroidaceae bacterium]